MDPAYQQEEELSVPVAETYVQAAEPTVVPAVVAPIDEVAVQEEEQGEPGVVDSAQEKRLKRMSRNRESAAQSRNRKKQHVDSLEEEIRQLKTTISSLTSENYELRKEQARMNGLPPPPPPEPVAMLAPIDIAPPKKRGRAEAAAADDGQPPIAVATAEATVAEAEAEGVARKTSADALLGLDTVVVHEMA